MATGNPIQHVVKTLNIDGTYTYDSEGQMTSVNYPTTFPVDGGGNPLPPVTGPTYTYSFDSMHRPVGLTDQNSNTVVNNVTYNPANQLLTFNNETRTYNNLNQMTRLTVTGNLDITYNFPAGTNNGKISSQLDNISGETVTYQYDSLNRLLTATATSTQSWSETYGFDGFGNLTSKTPTGGAPTLSIAVDPATNHIVGQSYDSHGNQLMVGGGYDAENRLDHAPGVIVRLRFGEQADLERDGRREREPDGAGSIFLRIGRAEDWPVSAAGEWRPERDGSAGGFE